MTFISIQKLLEELSESPDYPSKWTMCNDRPFQYGNTTISFKTFDILLKALRAMGHKKVFIKELNGVLLVKWGNKTSKVPPFKGISPVNGKRYV